MMKNDLSDDHLLSQVTGADHQAAHGHAHQTFRIEWRSSSWNEEAVDEHDQQGRGCAGGSTRQHQVGTAHHHAAGQGRQYWSNMASDSLGN